MRIEDLDQTRCRQEFVGGIFEDLRWLGLEWDEPVLVQSERTAAYDAALDELKSRGLVFPCFCTRADMAQSLTAPHGDAATSYPGTCRGLPDDPERRATTPHCWRLNSAKALELAGLPSWSEVDGQRFTANARDIGDAILARKEAPASYHLSCVVDDAESGVTMVVRGADLRASTPVQRLLQALLGQTQPPHHPPPPLTPRARRPRPPPHHPFPSRPTSTTRWSRTRTAAASPSATSRRRSHRCAKAG